MFNEHGSAGPASYFVQVTNAFALAVRQGEGAVIGRPVLPSCYLCLQKGHVLRVALSSAETSKWGVRRFRPKSLTNTGELFPDRPTRRELDEPMLLYVHQQSTHVALHEHFERKKGTKYILQGAIFSFCPQQQLPRHFIPTILY